MSKGPKKARAGGFLGNLSRAQAARPIPSLVFCALANFVFFLTVHKNASYHYLAGSGVLSFFVMMRLSFGGFALGLLSGRIFGKSLGVWGRKEIYRILAYASVAAFLLLNGFGAESRAGDWSSYAVSFSCAFAPAFLFGLAFSSAVRAEGPSSGEILLSIVLGSVAGVAIHNYFLVYLPFHAAYWLIFVALLFESLAYGKKGELLFFSIQCVAVLVFVVFQAGTFSKEYDIPGPYDGKETLNMTVHGPYGVLDIVSIDGSAGYHMFSDKTSPSQIVAKGDIASVQEQAIIPYLAREYSSVLVVGAGGGQDVVSALHHGAKKVTAVEIDSQRVGVMKNEFAEYTEGLFLDPRVSVKEKGAREFLRGNGEKYDLIVIERPWTKKATNALFYDASGELFTDEAIGAYLNALEEGGVLYFGIPFHEGETRPFSSIRTRLPEAKENLAILYPYRDKEDVVSVLLGPKEVLEGFRERHIEEYRFIYYPGKEVSLGENAINDCLFFGKGGCDRPRKDRQFYGAFDGREMGFRLFLAVAILSIAAFLAAAFGFGKEASYVALGAGYETASTLFALLASMFFFNFLSVAPVVIIAYLALGGVGYCLASGRSKKLFLVISFALVPLAFLLLVLARDLSGILAELVLCALFVSTGALITVPFGTLLSGEKNVEGALALDCLGGLFSIGLLFYLPNFDYLLAFLAATYLAVGAYLLIGRESLD